LELECILVDQFRWSLDAIDKMDIESLLPFIFYWPGYVSRKEGNEGKRMVSVDEIGFLL
jgi:hypothetical protein